MIDSQTSLAEYARTGSEAAFRDLVKRYIGLVYSSALRLVHGDTHLAEDVTQLVFINLARKARDLSTEVMLGGWLHQRTYNVAAPILRAERRRHAREKEAVQMNALHTDPDARLAQLAPILDEAITRLGRDDRKAIILRFFEHRDYRSIGEALGTSDDAAQKRVTRAVAKLHAQLISRGVTLSAAAIAAALTSQALTAAPAGLAASIAGTALASAAAGTGSTLALLKFMATTKLKTGIIGALIASGVLIVFFLRQDQNNSAQQINSPQLSVAESSTGSAATRHSGDRARGGFFQAEKDAAPAVPAAEIVAGKLTQFVRSRRELVQALARRHGVEVSDEVKRFFDAAEAGRYEEMQAIMKSLWNQRNIEPGSHDFDSYWSAILQTAGTAEQAHVWPAQRLLDYGNATLESLRPGMVYVGGTDPGFFIPMLVNETRDGERHIVLTQNALADPSYLDYVNDIYGDRIATLTQDDRQHALQEYIADYQKRFAHDQQFPDEPKQVFPKEEVRSIDGVLEPYGDISVMGVNQLLLQNLLKKNPDLSFALEESFPLKSTYADASPLGPVMELRASDQQNALTEDTAAQSVAYWRDLAQQLSSDPETPDGSAVRKAYAHMAEAQANLFASHNLNDQAEQAYGVAGTLWPNNRQILGSLSELLIREGRMGEANQLIDNFSPTNPK